MSETHVEGRNGTRDRLTLSIAGAALLLTIGGNLIDFGGTRADTARRLAEHDGKLADLRADANKGHEEQKGQIRSIELLVMARSEIVSAHTIELQGLARRLEVNERAIASVAAMDSRLSGIEAQLKGIERMVEAIQRGGDRRIGPP